VLSDQGEYESLPPGVAGADPLHTQTTQALAARSTPPHAATASLRETCHIAIPNYAVGAIIGAAGANIKRIIRDSNAFVTVRR